MFLEKRLVNLVATRLGPNAQFIVIRNISLSAPNNAKDNYKLVVVGGGSGGLAIASRFARKLGKNNVGIIEPSEWHCKIYLFQKF